MQKLLALLIATAVALGLLVSSVSGQDIVRRALYAPYVALGGGNVATVGLIRVPNNNNIIYSRNAANDGNDALVYLDASNVWQFANTNTRVSSFGGKLLSTYNAGGIGYGGGAGAAITQITSSATGVTLNTVTGQITTVALTTAAGAEEEFTVTNGNFAATDTVVLATSYAGAGTPMLSVKGAVAGSYKIVISNVHATNALNALMVINTAILKGMAS